MWSIMSEIVSASGGGTPENRQEDLMTSLDFQYDAHPAPAH